MKRYDYTKAKELIQQSADCLESAALGMHEDWFWTGQDVWADGQFTIDLDSHPEIMGIAESDWATPTLELQFKDGTTNMIPCFEVIGEELPLPDKLERQAQISSWHGVLSAPCQDNIPPLS